MERMRLFEFSAIREDGLEECGGCGYETSYKYVLAKNRPEAEYLLKEGLAGLCGDCMCKLLSSENYVIFRASLPNQILAEELPLCEADGINYEHFESIEDAQDFIKALEKGISGKEIALYTQVDADGETAYLKGTHVVNRTGVYMVAWR